MQVGPVGVSFEQAFDAIALTVQGNDGLAVEQCPGEIAEAAAYLDHSPS
jgi:hypothetical protein